MRLASTPMASGVSCFPVQQRSSRMKESASPAAGIVARQVRAEVRIAASCQRIARSRTLRRMWRSRQLRIAGGAEARTIRDRVRAALGDGTLSRFDGARVWAGYGTEHPCHVCGEVIRRRDIEHEVVETGGP